MNLSLFRSGLAPRLAAATLFGVLAFSAVAALGRRPSSETSAPPPPAEPAPATVRGTGTDSTGASATATIHLESLRPVAHWSIRVNGAAVSARSVDESSWLGETALSPGDSLVVDAEPAGSRSGPNAIRIRIAGTKPSREQTFWCTREWSVVSDVAALPVSPRPLDPADLP